MSDDRYARQALIPFIGREGQAKLATSTVALIGCGALGTAIANNLARAGVGRLRIYDRDFVELTNLQRQILFDEDDLEGPMPKAEAAALRCRKINSAISVEGVVCDINFTNIEALIAGADLVIDGTDNFETRYLVNDACVKNGVPWIYGSCVSTYGLFMGVLPGVTPCLRCVAKVSGEPGDGQTCDTAGVLNSIAAIIAAYESSEALKFLCGHQSAWVQGLTEIDVWSNSHITMPVPRNPDCPCCGARRFDFLEGREGLLLTSLCGRNAVQIVQRTQGAMDLDELQLRLSPLGDVTRSRFLLKFAVDAYELTVFPDARAIIKGTSDLAVARTVYAKYVGN